MMVIGLLLSLAMMQAGVTGTVKDTSGGAVAGATIVVRTESGGEQQSVVSGPDGRFAIENVPSGTTLVVRATGFAEKRVPLNGGEMEIVLAPASVLETVTVTPTRSEQRLGDIPASVSVIDNTEIRESPAIIADDVLKQVPTFSLFRRTSAIVAQPTTQGVSLRGIGPSGQSRTLVLLDGVPFNDPFGGWVYWTRIPMTSVDRVELTEGTASSLYGNYAMGGVINILTARPTKRTVEFKPQYGNYSSPKVDFFASDRWSNKIGVSIQGSYLDTDGFPIVADPEKGAIDNNANVSYQNTSGRLEYDPNPKVHSFFRVGQFTEQRNNGKVGELNDTRWTDVSGGARVLLADNSTLDGHLFVDDENSHFNFLAVTNAATTRNLVRLATDQRVPTNGVGGMVQWSKAVGSQHALSAGTDLRYVDGDSREDAYVPTVPTQISGVTQAATLSVQRVSGGTQRSVGAFVSDIYTPMPKLVLTLSGRVDYWKNYDGHNHEITVATGLPTANNRDSIPARDDTVFSPRVAALYHFTDRVSAWGAANSGFRAPTLTELYRQFSVGTVTTRPNDQLGPERLVGGEAGLNVAPARNLTARVTWYDNEIKDPISNVTLNATTAQKQNLGRTEIWGIQTDVEYRLWQYVRLEGAYLYNQAKVTDGGVTNAGLVGKYLPQVPVHRGSVQAAYSNPKYVNVAFNVQFSSNQYNDDQNVNFIPVPTLVWAGYPSDTPAGLPGYTTMDFTASRDFGSLLQVFFDVQNLTDAIYFVQTNPSTIGTPRLINGGVRIRWAGR